MSKKILNVIDIEKKVFSMECEVKTVIMMLLSGNFYEGETITVNIDGNVISRKVKYNNKDGLYIMYKNRKQFEYECDYTKVYKDREALKETK